ncbi:hypothetical protein LWI29_037169 [Acer saccharum]|uniref:Myb/SANT-like domain-containing protein n=1 Tax=Acer saccharum TaxID=4024 RepID=A0AA39SRG0_ACESA|nr:hypothetical protein LWI29_037169 [Acer saccharum]
MNNGARGKAIWDTASVALYCDLCIVEVEAERRPGTHFTKLGWDNLIVNFNKATGREYSKLQLKNKWDALNNDWKLWKQLIGKETGFGWNAQLKTIDAPEDWWLSKLEMCILVVHPGVAKFRKEGIEVEMEAKLDRMFMNITSTGEYAWAPSSGVLPSKDCQILDDDQVIPFDVNNLIQIKSEDGEGLEKENNKRNLEEDDKQAIKKKKSKKMVVKSGKVGGAPKLSQQIDRLIDAVESKKEANFGISEVMKLIESLPGVEIGSDLWLFSTHLFLAKEKREMFSIMKNPEIMLKWLNYEKSRESLN